MGVTRAQRPIRPVVALRENRNSVHLVLECFKGSKMVRDTVGMMFTKIFD